MYSGEIEAFMEKALQRTECCFKQYNNKYYYDADNVLFSPYHSGQYSIFLYYLANTIWEESKDRELCSVIYYLNKCLNSVDWFYEIKLPDSFAVEHPIGSVMGRAEYSNHILFYQGCTVGGSKRNGKPLYPELGEFVTMFANSSILGACKIGKHVVLGAGTLVKNQDIPDYSMVFGSSPNLIIKNKTKYEMEDYHSYIWKLD